MRIFRPSSAVLYIHISNDQLDNRGGHDGHTNNMSVMGMVNTVGQSGRIPVSGVGLGRSTPLHMLRRDGSGVLGIVEAGTQGPGIVCII